MLLFWIEFTLISIEIVMYFLLTLSFVFWIIYLVDVIKRKRIFYRNSLNSLQIEKGSYQQILTHNAETELVKYVFLFIMNIVEWLGCTFTIISSVILIVWEYEHNSQSNHSLPNSGFSVHIPIPSDLQLRLNLPNFNDVCLVLGFALIGSLCMYLAARYAQKSWIKSNTMMYWIWFFVINTIISQILVTICYTNIIGLWYDAILTTLVLIFAWKQYRKLNMVIQWSIVDLQVSKHYKMQTNQIIVKRIYNRIFTIIWIGTGFILASEYLEALSNTIQTLSHIEATVYSSLCISSKPSNRDFSLVRIILLYIETSCAVIGCLILFLPYTCCGLTTMSVMLWRLLRGRTGYRTRFTVQLYTPLM